MNVDLAIRLGDREARYAAGDPIEGFVEVVCREACRCRALVLRREWRVEGGGFCDSEVLDEVVLHRGQWAAGEVRSYPFEWRVPRGPGTYRGRGFALDWYLVAQARTDEDDSEPAERRFTLVPRPSACPPTLEVRHHGRVFSREALIAQAYAFVTWAWFVLITWKSDVPILGWTEWWEPLLDFVPIAVLVEVTRRLLVRRRLGPIEVHARPGVVCPGDEVRCELGFTPQRATTVESATVTLVATERSDRRDEDGEARTDSHEVYREECVAGLDFFAAGGRRQDLRVDLRVPADAMCSVATAAGHFALEWKLVFEVLVDPGPGRWTRTVPLTVVH